MATIEALKEQGIDIEDFIKEQAEKEATKEIIRLEENVECKKEQIQSLKETIKELFENNQVVVFKFNEISKSQVILTWAAYGFSMLVIIAIVLVVVFG